MNAKPQYNTERSITFPLSRVRKRNAKLHKIIIYDFGFISCTFITDIRFIVYNLTYPSVHFLK